ncbi:MAG: permease-like cell division protein FtsX [Legionellaceae bacterium]|nr:permease-like cell division protein FtsX [Legionellaceae bacterium]
MMTMRSWIAFHKQAFLNSLAFLWRGRWSTLMTVLVIAMTLMMSAMFWVVTNNVSRLTVDWRQSGRISLYLDVGLSEADEASLLARVRATPGVGEASVKTSAEGLAALQMQDGMQDIMHYLPENPLPAVIDVMPAPTVHSAEVIAALYQTIKTYPHIEQAKLDMEWIGRLFAFFSFVTKLVHSLMVMLAIAVVLIIGNTLRMIIHDRHDDIVVLKLVGAGDAFIMRPFLYTGVLYGLLAAIVAVICVDLFVLSLDAGLNQLFASYQIHYTLSGMSMGQTGLLVMCAILLSWLGARLSVKKHIT